MDKPLWGGRGRDLGGACPYSRRGLRLRRRGAYGIHRAFGPRCQGLCRKVASLRSGGRRLAVRIMMECHFCALPRTPFCHYVAFHPQGSVSLDSRVASLPYESSSLATSRGNKKFEEKNRESYTSCTSPAFPLWWLAPPPCPLGSVSLDSQSPTAPCESSSLPTTSGAL